MSDFTDVCDDVVTDLTTNVAALADATTHRYAPWDAEELAASPGETHLAVWPEAEGAESAVGFVTGPGADEITQRYRVAYWEHIGKEGAQGVVDATATATMLTLHNAVRARFYVSANIVGAAAFGTGTMAVRYLGTVFGARAGAVRWFAMTISTIKHISVT